MKHTVTIPYSHLFKVEFREPLWLVKLLNYEYWPFWILFFPAVIYWLFLSLKAKSFTWFTAANPGFELGGFFGESKTEILKKIPPHYLPVTLYFNDDVSLENIKQQMQINNLQFPIICKPDKGERGFHVEKIITDAELKNYLLAHKGKLIVQEFISFTHELGILYYRLPDENTGGITSVVKKNFLSVKGDGIATIEQLILQSARARMQLTVLKKKLGNRLNIILPAGEKYLLEPIGNHCRGTEFINGNYLINDSLVKVFDKIATNMNGFYYGRFDLKVKSMDDLYAGNNIRIMEVNGVSSEPAHIYDSHMNIFKAVSAIIYNTKISYKISMLNHKNGVAFIPLRLVLKTVLHHFKNKK